MNVETPEMPADSQFLAGQRVAFAGVLATMTHAQAGELVIRHGGTPIEYIGQQTTIVVIGDRSSPLETDGLPLKKLRQAQQLQASGVVISILSEAEWLQALGWQQGDEAHQWHTLASVSQLLELPLPVVRRWERQGLIRPVTRVGRLAYFDFKEVATARHLANLLQAGISCKVLEDSLRGLATDSSKRSLQQLSLLASGDRVLARDQHGLWQPKTGQRLLDFTNARGIEGREIKGRGIEGREAEGRRILPLGPCALAPSIPMAADDWFQRGCDLCDDARYDDAIEALRCALMHMPERVEIHSHLAEALYRSGQTAAALERYYCCVERDHDDLEAWTQIGCLHLEADDPQLALTAFDIALQIHPGYAEAHYLKADTLDSEDRKTESAVHWQAYLNLSPHGPWAENARRRLDCVTADARVSEAD